MSTPFSESLIDLSITNSPLSIVKSGVVKLSISDHALVYMTRKARKVSMRANSSRIWSRKSGTIVATIAIPMTCGKHGEDCLMECINTHAPLRCTAISKKCRGQRQMSIIERRLKRNVGIEY